MSSRDLEEEARKAFTSPSGLANRRLAGALAQTKSLSPTASDAHSRRSVSLITSQDEAELFDTISVSTSVNLSPSSRSKKKGGSSSVNELLEGASSVAHDVMRSFSQTSVSQLHNDDETNGTWTYGGGSTTGYYASTVESVSASQRTPLDLHHNDNSFHVLANLLVEFLQNKVAYDGKFLVLQPEDRVRMDRLLPEAIRLDFIDAVRYRLERTPSKPATPLQYLTLQCQELGLDNEGRQNPILVAANLKDKPAIIPFVALLKDNNSFASNNTPSGISSCAITTQASKTEGEDEDAVLSARMTDESAEQEEEKKERDKDEEIDLVRATTSAKQQAKINADRLLEKFREKVRKEKDETSSIASSKAGRAKGREVQSQVQVATLEPVKQEERVVVIEVQGGAKMAKMVSKDEAQHQGDAEKNVEKEAQQQGDAEKNVKGEKAEALKDLPILEGETVQVQKLQSEANAVETLSTTECNTAAFAVMSEQVKKSFSINPFASFSAVVNPFAAKPPETSPNTYAQLQQQKKDIAQKAEVSSHDFSSTMTTGNTTTEPENAEKNLLSAELREATNLLAESQTAATVKFWQDHVNDLEARLKALEEEVQNSTLKRTHNILETEVDPEQNVSLPSTLHSESVDAPPQAITMPTQVLHAVSVPAILKPTHEQHDPPGTSPTPMLQEKRALSAASSQTPLTQEQRAPSAASSKTPLTQEQRAPSAASSKTPLTKEQHVPSATTRPTPPTQEQSVTSMTGPISMQEQRAPSVTTSPTPSMQKQLVPSMTTSPTQFKREPTTTSPTPFKREPTTTSPTPFKREQHAPPPTGSRWLQERHAPSATTSHTPPLQERSTPSVAKSLPGTMQELSETTSPTKPFMQQRNAPSPKSQTPTAQEQKAPLATTASTSQVTRAPSPKSPTPTVQERKTLLATTASSIEVQRAPSAKSPEPTKQEESAPSVTTAPKMLVQGVPSTKSPTSTAQEQKTLLATTASSIEVQRAPSAKSPEPTKQEENAPSVTIAPKMLVQRVPSTKSSVTTKEEENAPPVMTAPKTQVQRAPSPKSPTPTAQEKSVSSRTTPTMEVMRALSTKSPAPTKKEENASSVTTAQKMQVQRVPSPKSTAPMAQEQYVSSRTTPTIHVMRTQSPKSPALTKQEENAPLTTTSPLSFMHRAPPAISSLTTLSPMSLVQHEPPAPSNLTTTGQEQTAQSGITPTMQVQHAPSTKSPVLTKQEENAPSATSPMPLVHRTQELQMVSQSEGSQKVQPEAQRSLEDPVLSARSCEQQPILAGKSSEQQPAFAAKSPVQETASLTLTARTYQSAPAARSYQTAPAASCPGQQPPQQHSDKMPESGSTTSTSYDAPMVDVVAPADLPGGYHFEAELEGKRFLATVPEGGVQQGETFTCYMRELDSVAIDIPVGYWKDDLSNLCEYGCCHSAVWNAIFCPLIALGQIQTRVGLDFLGRPRESTNGMTNRGMMLIVMSSWLLMNVFLIYGYNYKWARGMDLTIADMAAFGLVNVSMFGFIVFVTQSTRTTLRELFMIREQRCNDLEDICCATCCLPCTVGQMSRHTANYDDYEAVCCSKTGLPDGVRVNQRPKNAGQYVV